MTRQSYLCALALVSAFALAHSARLTEHPIDLLENNDRPLQDAQEPRHISGYFQVRLDLARVCRCRSFNSSLTYRICAAQPDIRCPHVLLLFRVPQPQIRRPSSAMDDRSRSQTRARDRCRVIQAIGLISCFCYMKVDRAVHLSWQCFTVQKQSCSAGLCSCCGCILMQIADLPLMQKMGRIISRRT